MSEPGEIQDGPADTEPEELESPGPWRNVPQPTTDELMSPGAQVADTPKIPMAVKVGGLALVAVLLLVAAWLGLALGGAGGSGPQSDPKPSIDETLWQLEPPKTLGGFVVGDVTSTPLSTSSDRAIVTATYTDGSDKLVLLLSRPEDKVATYLDDVGVEDTESVDKASCGTSADNAVPLCARVVDDTAIAVAGLSEQEFPELASLVDAFYDELS